MTVTILKGDCRDMLATLPAENVHCAVTSPPYFGLRDYGVTGQIGLEPSPEAFVSELVAVFRAVRRVLRDDGTVWLNLGDSYAASGGGGAQGSRGQRFDRRHTQETLKPVAAALGLKPKDLIGIPWRVAFALQADGWYLRQDIIWSKPNPMPESVRDRCTKAHEYVFMLSKSERYHYDADAIAEDAIYSGLVGQDASGFKNAANFDGKHSGGNPVRGERPDKQRGHSRRHAGFNDRWDSMKRTEQCSGKRNKRSVWSVATAPFAEAHFATFPPALVEPCILAGCPKGGSVLDPFGGAGTTGLVAGRLGRNAILIELNPEYADMAERRIRGGCRYVCGGGGLTSPRAIGTKRSPGEAFAINRGTAAQTRWHGMQPLGLDRIISVPKQPHQSVPSVLAPYGHERGGNMTARDWRKGIRTCKDAGPTGTSTRADSRWNGYGAPPPHETARGLTERPQPAPLAIPVGDSLFHPVG